MPLVNIGITSTLEGILVILARQISFAARAKRGTHNGIWRAKITNMPDKVDVIRIIVQY